MIGKLYRLLFGLKTREKLPRLPRHLANEFDHRLVDQAEAQILARTAARDRRGIERLMARHGVETAEELAALIPYQKPKADWRKRLDGWLQRLAGETPYETVVRPFIREREQEKRP